MSQPTSDMLARAVLPLFVPDERRLETPARAGSCVLVHLFGQHFVVTARHNFSTLDRQMYFLGKPSTQEVVEFTVHGIFTVKSLEQDLDVALIPLTPSQLTLLEGLTPIPEKWIELVGYEYLAADEFQIFGYSQTNSQFRVDRAARKIVQKSFNFRTGAASVEVATRENVDLCTHFLVEFDPEKVTVNGERYTPPDPVGISGGAAFHIDNGKAMLAGIMIEHRKDSKALVGVRACEIVAIADHVVRGQ